MPVMQEHLPATIPTIHGSRKMNGCELEKGAFHAQLTLWGNLRARPEFFPSLSLIGPKFGSSMGIQTGQHAPSQHGPLQFPY
jgi:hypothetical protein